MRLRGFFFRKGGVKDEDEEMNGDRREREDTFLGIDEELWEWWRNCSRAFRDRLSTAVPG